MGTIFLRSDSDKWGQGSKWGQSESGDDMLFLPLGDAEDMNRKYMLVQCSLEDIYSPFVTYFNCSDFIV